MQGCPKTKLRTPNEAALYPIPMLNCSPGSYVLWLCAFILFFIETRSGWLLPAYWAISEYSQDLSHTVEARKEGRLAEASRAPQIGAKL